MGFPWSTKNKNARSPSASPTPGKKRSSSIKSGGRSLRLTSGWLLYGRPPWRGTPLQEDRFHPTFVDLVAAFNTAGAKFLIVGGYAFSFYGPIRATKDLDIWVEASSENAPRVYSGLAAFGAPSGHFAQEDFSSPGITVQLGVEPIRIDILTQITGVLFEEAWPARVRGRFADQDVWFIGREHFLLNKRATGRLQDEADAEQVETRGPKPIT